jgi:radical SAM superfamily enzyme YgiQ (UPF0313 family)
MRVSLSSSLHLDHGTIGLDSRPGDQPPMQAFVPVGLLALKAIADREHVDADIRVVEINGMINRREITNGDRFHDAIVDAIWSPGDDFAGLMTDADSLMQTVMLARRIKERDPRTRVCLGGPASSPIATLMLERFPCIDYIARGEADHTFVELLQAIDRGREPHDVLGLTWRSGDGIVENGNRPLAECDDLPIVDFDAYDMSYGAPLYLDVGRGCPFRCRFCATAPFWGRRYRMKSTERILEELYIVRDRFGRRHVNFSHDIFTTDRKWTLAFCERMAAENLGMTWSCSTRTDVIDPPMLEQMARAGCVEIYYGIETGSKETQEFIDKGLDLDWSREIVRATAACGIRPVTGFIVGHPNETRETLTDTLTRFFDFLDVGKVRAHLFTLCPFQEAPLFHQYAPTIDRPAEYNEIPLTAAAAQELYSLRDGQPDVFSSAFRFATPGVPAELVDASEELSCHLVVLKSLWPLLLPFYQSPLDWYERWVPWIAARNARYRAESRLRHQGNAYDLLDFVGEEIERLGLQESDIADLVRYERTKLDARALAAPRPVSEHAEPLRDSSLLGKRCNYLAGAFQYDLSRLLAGSRSDLRGPSWVIFAKTGDASIDTVHATAEATRLLELVHEAAPLSDIARRLGDELGVPAATTLRLAESLCARGILQEVQS